MRGWIIAGIFVTWLGTETRTNGGFVAKYLIIFLFCCLLAAMTYFNIE